VTAPDPGYYQVSVSGSAIYQYARSDGSHSGSITINTTQSAIAYFSVVEVDLQWEGAQPLVTSDSGPDGNPIGTYGATSSIKNKTGEVLIGQDIGLTASYLPTDGLTGTQAWQIPGANGSPNASPAAITSWNACATPPVCVVNVANTTPFHPTTSFYWTEPGSHQQAQQVSYSATICGKQLQASTTLYLDYPAFRVSQPEKDQTYLNSLYNGGADGYPEIHAGYEGTNGIPGIVNSARWTGTAYYPNADVNGQGMWVQVILSNLVKYRYKPFLGPAFWTSLTPTGNSIDNDFPLTPSQKYGTQDYRGYDMDDGPEQPAPNGYDGYVADNVQVDISFNDTFLYAPFNTPSAAANFVPAGSESWTFGGSAYRTGSDYDNIADWKQYASPPLFLNNLGASTTGVDWPTWTTNIKSTTQVPQ
jgi:hypothetical protein